MKLLSLEETANRLDVAPTSLADKRYRVRIGLPAVKAGRRIGFAEHDIEKLITRGREKLPISSGGKHD